MGKMLTNNDYQNFSKELKIAINNPSVSRSHEEKIKVVRSVFFANFRLSDKVPAELIDKFVNVASYFYDKASFGYNGIMEEIRDRVYLYSDIDGYVEIRHFLKHGDNETDIYDKENRIGYEKKTGCGDWLRSERYTTLSEVIEEYKRKKTRIRWDYEYKAQNNGMTGEKSVNKNLSMEEQEKEQKRTKTKASKEYNISIHIETTYKKLFEYMETYPKGIETFFVESVRSGQAGVYVWKMQTLKNSKKKIDFLQNFNG